MKLKQTDTFIELDIIVDGVTVGNAEIEPNKRELSRLVIYEPYRNKGYGTQAVKMLVETYKLDNLWVRSDNEAARDVYDDIKTTIAVIDSADVAPVVHGHWENKYERHYIFFGTCSVCKHVCQENNICGNCGAIMDEREGK